jgi:DNA-binding protein HU-beta
MTKNELVDLVASAAGISKADANKAVDAIVVGITQTLNKGDTITVPGLGTFYVGNRKERSGRNPRTGETITIPAAKVPRFRAGSKLKEEVNK